MKGIASPTSLYPVGFVSIAIFPEYEFNKIELPSQQEIEDTQKPETGREKFLIDNRALIDLPCLS